MFRVCAWCERFLGFIPPASDLDVTHGICGECDERLHREEMPRRGRTLIIVRRSQRKLRDRLEAHFAGVPGIEVRMDQRVGEHRQGGPAVGPDLRHRDHRRPLFPSQRAAWTILGVYVVD